jgi:hypothetical protein
MKKLSFLIFTLILLSMNAGAQWFVRAGVGAAISTASSMVYDRDMTNSQELYSAKKNGYGTGLPVALAAGYWFGENVGIELGVDYFYGFSSKYTFKDDYTDLNFKTYGTMLSLVPALVGRITLDKMTPYARLGLMIGVMNSIITKCEGNSNSPEFKTSVGKIESKQKLSGGMAIGVQAALGSDYALSDLISLFAEFQLYGISYAPKKGQYKTYKIDGQDQLGNMTTKQKEWKYVKKYDAEKVIPDSEPDELPKINTHFNNFGILVGVKITIP